MDDVALARVALSRAIDDVQVAITRVRSAQHVEWHSVFAPRYRHELREAVRELSQFCARLESARQALL